MPIPLASAHPTRARAPPQTAQRLLRRVSTQDRGDRQRPRRSPTMNVYYFTRHLGAVLRRLCVLSLRAGFAARDVPQSCSRLGRRSLGSAVSGWAVMAPLRYRFPRPSLAGRSPCTQGSKTCGVVSRYGRLVSALATAGISAMISACHPGPGTAAIGSAVVRPVRHPNDDLRPLS